MRTKILITALIFIASLQCFSAVNLVKATEEYGIHCGDEVYVDTNGISDHPTSSEINDRIYAKEGFVIYLNEGIFNKKFDQTGKLSKIQVLTVEDITSNYIDEYVPKFEKIKNLF